MARAVDIDEKVLDSLAEVFEAAWLVVGRRGHSLDQEEEEQLRCDLASQIARLAAGGITDSRELVRRSILRFVHGGRCGYAKVLTMDEARRVAANIAKLRTLLRHKADGFFVDSEQGGESPGAFTSLQGEVVAQVLVLREWRRGGQERAAFGSPLPYVPCQLAKTVAAFFPKVLTMAEARRVASRQAPTT